MIKIKSALFACIFDRHLCFDGIRRVGNLVVWMLVFHKRAGAAGLQSHGALRLALLEDAARVELEGVKSQLSQYTGKRDVL